MPFQPSIGQLLEVDSLSKLSWEVLAVEVVDSVDAPEIKSKWLPKTNSRVSGHQIQNLFDRVVELFENHGYPFVTVQLIDVTTDNHKLNATLEVDPGQYIHLDSLICRTDRVLSPAILQQVTGLKTGAEYSEGSIRRAEERISSSGFLSNHQAPEIGFFD